VGCDIQSVIWLEVLLIR